MAIFNSYMLNYQRVDVTLRPRFDAARSEVNGDPVAACHPSVILSADAQLGEELGNPYP